MKRLMRSLALALVLSLVLVGAHRTHPVDASPDENNPVWQSSSVLIMWEDIDVARAANVGTAAPYLATCSDDYWLAQKLYVPATDEYFFCSGILTHPSRDITTNHGFFEPAAGPFMILFVPHTVYLDRVQGQHYLMVIADVNPDDDWVDYN